MKKTVLTLALIALAVVSAAQPTGKSILDSLERKALPASMPTVDFGKIFSLRPLGHLGYGWDRVSSSDFTPHKGHSGEFFVNALTLRVFPIRQVGLEIGLDYQYSFIESEKEAFRLDDDRNVYVIPLESVGYNYDSAISILSFHKITMPILLKARLSFVNLGFGVEPAYTVGALAKCRFRSSTDKVDLKALRPGVDRFTYCLMGTLSVAGTVGGFIKYYPSGACQIPEGGPKYNYWTIGISFGF